MSNTNYKTLFKATTLFGLVEILRIALRIIVHKFASTFFGASGYGVIGLIENAAQLIISLTNFGLNYTGLRLIASSNNSDDITLNKSIKLVTLFSLLTGVLAAFISIVLSNKLSHYSFNNSNYTWWFVALAAYFISNSYVQSRIIVLEALQNINKLLSINVVINLTNTIVIITSYYLFYFKGVFIAMIVTSLINCYLFWRGTKKYRISAVEISKKELKNSIKSFSSSGILLAINTTIGLAAFMVIRYYFKSIDNGEILGYYHAANTLLVSYVGIVFIAISKFYYPKLSQESNKGTIDYNTLVNNQLEICLLMLMPIIFILYLFGEFFISILFSDQFLPIYQILIFGLAALFVKGYNYVVGYILLSKNNIKQYFIINAVSDLLNAFLSILFYKHFGLYGIGLAIFVNYILSAVYLNFYVKARYKYVIDKQIAKLILMLVVGSSFIICSYFYGNSIIYYAVTFIIFMLSTIYSVVKLDEYLLNSSILQTIKRIRKK